VDQGHGTHATEGLATEETQLGEVVCIRQVLEGFGLGPGFEQVHNGVVDGAGLTAGFRTGFQQWLLLVEKDELVLCFAELSKKGLFGWCVLDGLVDFLFSEGDGPVFAPQLVFFLGVGSTERNIYNLCWEQGIFYGS
jgi:hypothetical protein